MLVFNFIATDNNNRTIWSVRDGTVWMSASFVAYYRHDTRDYENHRDEPQAFEVQVAFETFEERDAFVGKFPKSVKMKATTLTSQTKVIPYATMHVGFMADDVNKGKNEGGIKRIAAMLRAIEKYNLPVGWQVQYGNGYSDPVEFFNLIGTEVAR